MGAVTAALTSAGVPIMDSCADLDGLTLGGLKAMAQTAGSGLLIASTADCANSNSALLTPLLDTPHNQNLAKDESAKLQLSSPKKSQIRFCPRDGQERDHTKNIALKAMHEGGAKGRMQKQQSISAQKKREQIKEVRKRRDIEMRSEAKANQEQHSERHSRRVRSDQADDGQSKYFRVQES